MPRRSFVFAPLAVALAASAACAGALQKPPPLLTEARGYNDGIRWGQPERAALRVPPGQRSDFVSERERHVDDLRVGDYEIRSIRYRDARTEARIDVRYTWHLDSRGVVHRTTARQIWQRRGKSWLMVEEQRLRGEPMPGLAEPEPESDVVGEGSESSDDGSPGADDEAADSADDSKGQVVFDSGPVSRQ